MDNDSTEDPNGIEPPVPRRRHRIKRLHDRPPISAEETALLQVACRLSRTGGYRLDAASRHVFWSYEVACIYELEPTAEISYEKALA